MAFFRNHGGRKRTRRSFATILLSFFVIDEASEFSIQKLESAIHGINLYAVDDF